MASIRPITVYGEPVLHRRAAEVEVIDDEIRELIEDMYVTQDAAHGVGLAAPQVGVGLRIFTWTFPDSGDAPNVGHVINPVLTHLDKAPREDPHPDEHTEGCLSVPGLGFPLQRPTRVRLSGQRVDGEMFDRSGTPWPEADITIVDLATFAREGYNAQLSIAYISLINTVNNIAERDQFLGRPIINVTDEGHIITNNQLGFTTAELTDMITKERNR